MLIMQSGVLTPNKFDASKWRFIRDIKMGDGKFQLYVVTYPLDWWAVRSVSMKEFLEHHETNEILYSPEINFIKNTESCQICGGWGVFDWITSVRGYHLGKTLPYSNHNPEDFKIDKIVNHWRLENTCWKGKTGIPLHPEYISTTPQMEASDKLCEMCFGSGMQLTVKDGNCIFMNTLGRWYTKNKNEDYDGY